MNFLALFLLLRKVFSHSLLAFYFSEISRFLDQLFYLTISWSASDTTWHFAQFIKSCRSFSLASGDLVFCSVASGTSWFGSSRYIWEFVRLKMSFFSLLRNREFSEGSLSGFGFVCVGFNLIQVFSQVVTNIESTSWFRTFDSKSWRSYLNRFHW